LEQPDCQTTCQHISSFHSSLFAVFLVNPRVMVAQILGSDFSSPNRAMPSKKGGQTRSKTRQPSADETYWLA
jgi:hypothetical protein